MILIPARNEGPRIGRVICGVQAVCPGVPVLVVANGCTDDTVAVARTHGAQVVLSPPGYATALATGYRAVVAMWNAAEASGPRWLVQLDADGQHPPESIPDVLAGLEHAELVLGSRLVSGQAPDWMGARRWAVEGLGLWTSVLVGYRLRDVTSGFMGLSESVVRYLAENFPNQVADANVLVEVDQAGFGMVEVPVVMSDRDGGDSMHGGWRSIVYTAKMAALCLRERSRRTQPGRADCAKGALGG